MVITLNKNRVISSVIAAAYVVVGFTAGGGEGGLKALAFVILPLACIWFSTAMGDYTGPAGNIWISGPSPGLFVCIAGWLLLLFPVLAIILNFINGTS